MINNMMLFGLGFAYLIVTMVIGFSAAKKPQTIENFFLGGRKSSALIIALTFSSTSMSGLLFLGFSGKIYTEGLQSLWFIVPSATIGILFSYRLVSKKVRLYSEYVGALTVMEILRKRYGNKSNLLINLTAFMTVIATIMYVSGQLIAAGKLVKLVFGFDYTYAILTFTTVIIAYTALGGFTAVCWTDVFQGIMMILASLLAGLFIIHLSNGIDPFWHQVEMMSQRIPIFQSTPFASSYNIILGLTIFMGDGIMNWIGQPTLMTKYMSAKNEHILKKSSYLSVLFQVILFTGVFMCSIYMRLEYFKPEHLPFGNDIETIFIQFFLIKVTPFFGGIILGGIMAAIMSTADSLLILSSSVLINDVLLQKHQHLKQTTLIFLSKLTTLILGCLIMVISLNAQTVLDTAWVGWTILGIIGVPIIIGLYWKRATLQAATASQFVGLIVLVMWQTFDLTVKTGIFYAFAAGLASYITIFIVSYLTPPPPLYIQKEIDDLKNDYHYEHFIEI